jgi:hypothetical protein
MIVLDAETRSEAIIVSCGASGLTTFGENGRDVERVSGCLNSFKPGTGAFDTGCGRSKARQIRICGCVSVRLQLAEIADTAVFGYLGTGALLALIITGQHRSDLKSILPKTAYQPDGAKGVGRRGCVGKALKQVSVDNEID